MSPRLLFLGVFTPLGVLARPLWRRRLALGVSPRAQSYWRRREARPLTGADLHTRR